MVSLERSIPRTFGLARRVWLSSATVRVIQASWLVLLVGMLTATVVTTTALYDTYQTTCHDDVCETLPQPNAHTLQQLDRLGIALDNYAAAMVLVEWQFSLLCMATGAVIIWKRPRDPVGLAVTFGFLALSGNTFLQTLDRTDAVNDLLVRITMLVMLASAPVFIALFPDGRWVPRWTRWVATFGVGATAYGVFTDPPRPWLLDELLGLRTLVVWGCLLGAQIYRYRRVAAVIQRQQTKLLLYGVGVLVALNAVAIATSIAGSIERYQLLIMLGVYGAEQVLVVAVGLAILRYRLFTIDLIINRTLVYLVLTASVVAIYVVLVGWLGTVFRTGGNLLFSLLATGVVAVLFQPLRARIQRGINRLLYGERDEPYTVIARLGRRLEATLAPDAVLPAIATTVREALKLPYSAIALQQGDARVVVAAVGEPVANPMRLPLMYQHEPVGELLLAPRAPGEAFSPADRRLLDDLARQAGVAVHAVQLSADLQRSRERLVAAREEERRRLRRDLHDGLGPLLGSLTLKLDVADDLLERDPVAAHALLRDLKRQAQTAIVDIRRLVYALRPPALDDLGLVGALRAEAAHEEQSGLAVIVEAPSTVPPLPAAVEVAVYRIALEALTNVVRHARAQTCTIRIALGAAALDLEITDDGCGLPVERVQGVGLASMRERAEELGGSFGVEARPDRGTRVWARLPLAASVAASQAGAGAAAPSVPAAKGG